MRPIAAPQQHNALAGAPGETLGETLYQTILRKLLYGELSYHTRLIPAEIAEQFGVSPTPVREALARLALGGYIQAIPRRGYHVQRPAAQHLIDTWQVRLGLELTAGEIAIEKMKAGEVTPVDLDDLQKIQKKIAAGNKPNDHRRHSELNSEFHRRIIGLSGNRMLVAIYDSVQMHVLRAWIQRGSDGWTQRLEGEATEHTAILDALRGADFQRYADATRAHLSRSLRDAQIDLDRPSTAKAKLVGI